MTDWRSTPCQLHDLYGCVTCSPDRKAMRRLGSRGIGSLGGEASVEYGVGVVRLESPYNAEFVAELKAVLPAQHRRWVPSLRVWEISEEYWDQVSELVEDYFTLVE